jgi:hypothetical protein
VPSAVKKNVLVRALQTAEGGLKTAKRFLMVQWGILFDIFHC